MVEEKLIQLLVELGGNGVILYALIRYVINPLIGNLTKSYSEIAKSIDRLTSSFQQSDQELRQAIKDAESNILNELRSKN